MDAAKADKLRALAQELQGLEEITLTARADHMRVLTLTHLERLFLMETVEDGVYDILNNMAAMPYGSEDTAALLQYWECRSLATFSLAGALSQLAQERGYSDRGNNGPYLNYLSRMLMAKYLGMAWEQLYTVKGINADVKWDMAVLSLGKGIFDRASAEADNNPNYLSNDINPGEPWSMMPTQQRANSNVADAYVGLGAYFDLSLSEMEL